MIRRKPDGIASVAAAVMISASSASATLPGIARAPARQIIRSGPSAACARGARLAAERRAAAWPSVAALVHRRAHRRRAAVKSTAASEPICDLAALHNEPNAAHCVPRTQRRHAGDTHCSTTPTNCSAPGSTAPAPGPRSAPSCSATRRCRWAISASGPMVGQRARGLRPRHRSRAASRRSASTASTVGGSDARGDRGDRAAKAVRRPAPLHATTGLPADAPKLLIVAPMSGHYATLLRGTVARMVENAARCTSPTGPTPSMVPAERRPLRSRRLHRLPDRVPRASSAPART